MLSYAEAVDHLYALGQELAPAPAGQPRRKFDLAHMRVLAQALDDPQRRFPSVLIAGTNGKGSTAATLASILHAAGLRTALYTSPHLFRVNERIRIDGESIADDTFARLYGQVLAAADALVADHRLPFAPSFFEMLTALAFLHFAEQQVEMAVLEVGLGGRLDATNIVQPILSILTDIALDHQEYLGTTIAEITREKAGILRPGGTLITLPQHPEANQAIGEAAAGLNLHAINAASLIPTPESFFGEPAEPSHPLPRNRYTLTVRSQPLRVDSPLPGVHQQRNIALAIAAALELERLNENRNKTSYTTAYDSGIGNTVRYKCGNQAIEQGIRNTQWPGRLELIAPDLLVDVAHNPAGAWALRAALAHLPEHRPRTLLFSCLRDKNIEEMTRILFPLFDSSSSEAARATDHIILAPIANARAASMDTLLAAAHLLDVPVHAAPHVSAALAQARAVTPRGGLIVATGSVYLVGELRHLVLGR